jgi:hypothetical protein
MDREEFDEMVRKGLISVEPFVTVSAKLISQLDIKYYTREQNTPDIWASWLRLNRRN